MSHFKQAHSFVNRCNESERVLNKYPTRVPIICEKSYFYNNHNQLPDINKHKYLVPSELTIGQFIGVIRKRMKLSADEAIFLFVSNSIPPSSFLIGQIYKQYKDPDGFLYVQYAKENVFG